MFSFNQLTSISFPITIIHALLSPIRRLCQYCLISSLIIANKSSSASWHNLPEGLFVIINIEEWPASSLEYYKATQDGLHKSCLSKTQRVVNQEEQGNETNCKFQWNRRRNRNDAGRLPLLAVFFILAGRVVRP